MYAVAWNSNIEACIGWCGVCGVSDIRKVIRHFSLCVCVYIVSSHRTHRTQRCYADILTLIHFLFVAFGMPWNLCGLVFVYIYFEYIA